MFLHFSLFPQPCPYPDYWPYSYISSWILHEIHFSYFIYFQIYNQNKIYCIAHISYKQFLKFQVRGKLTQSILIVHLLPPILQSNWVTRYSMRLSYFQISCLWKYILVKIKWLSPHSFHISKHSFMLIQFFFFHLDFFSSLSLNMTTFCELLQDFTDLFFLRHILFYLMCYRYLHLFYILSLTKGFQKIGARRLRKV